LRNRILKTALRNKHRVGSVEAVTREAAGGD
jgi:hypothetical protein